MANDSVTDESNTHQSPRKNRKMYGSGAISASQGTTFNLHLTYHDWLVLSRLLAIGSQMSLEATPPLAHEWEALSRQIDFALRHAKVRHEIEDYETNNREA